MSQLSEKWHVPLFTFYVPKCFLLLTQCYKLTHLYIKEQIERS